MTESLQKKTVLPSEIKLVFLILLSDTIAIGMTIPVLPALVNDVVGGNTAFAARMVGWIVGTWAFVNFLCSPMIGALSDLFGRRKIIAASTLGTAIDYVLVFFAPSIIWLFIARVASGATNAVFVTVNAYIADVTDLRARAARFGQASAMFSLGMIIGPITGGIIGEFDPRFAFLIAALLSTLNSVLAWKCLPDRHVASPASGTKFSLSPLRFISIYRKSVGLSVLGVVFIFFHLSQQAQFSATVPYLTFQFGWSPAEIAAAAVAIGLSAALVQLKLVGPVIQRIGEKCTILLGLLAGIGAHLVFAFSTVGSVFLIGILPFAFVGLVGPAMQGLMSREVGATQQGQLQGANASLVAAATMVAAPLYMETYAFASSTSLGWVPVGLLYVLAALFLTSAILVLLRLKVNEIQD